MKLTHRQFEILVTAAESESFSAAAQHLRISQPSLSESIRRIERELGTKLFERTTRSLKLTPEGRRVTAVAREIVRDFKRALDRLSRGNAQSSRIAVAALPSIACAVIPRTLDDFSRSHPGIGVIFHDVQHERALRLLTEGIDDLAITLKPPRQEELACRASGVPARRSSSAAQVGAVARLGGPLLYRVYQHFFSPPRDRRGLRTIRNGCRSAL
jgi:DNA-binding transcriptional LysR family regulator